MIVIVRFMEPIQVKLRDLPIWVSSGISELTLHSTVAPTVEYPPDGKAKNGYLNLGNGLVINQDKLRSWEVIPGGGKPEAKPDIRATGWRNLKDWLHDQDVVRGIAIEPGGPDLQHVGDVKRLDPTYQDDPGPDTGKDQWKMVGR